MKNTLIFLIKIEDENDVEKAKQSIGIRKKILHPEQLIGMYYQDLNNKIGGEEQEKIASENREDVEVDLFWYKGKDIPIIYRTRAYKLDDGRIFFAQVYILKETKV